MAESEEDEEQFKSKMIRTNCSTPMILISRKDELSNFNVEDHDMFIIQHPREEQVDENEDVPRTIEIYYETDEGTSQEDESKDELFSLYINSGAEQLEWKAENYQLSEIEQISQDEMRNICRKVLNYVMEHSEDSRNTLKLYLKFFDLLDGYKKTLLNEIGDFLKDAITPDYEQNKKLNKFLQLFAFSIDMAHETNGPMTLICESIRPLADEGFLTDLIQAFMKYISDLLKRNRFTHFTLERSSIFETTYMISSKEHRQIYGGIANDLINRKDLFDETQKFLEKEKITTPHSLTRYSAIHELLYFLPRAVDHPVVVFEAIENYVNGKRGGDLDSYEIALNSIECLQFLLPELPLLLDKTKQLQTFPNKDTMQIVIDVTNRTYRILLERAGQTAFKDCDRFRDVGGKTREMALSNLTACDVYNIEYSMEIENSKFPVDYYKVINAGQQNSKQPFSLLNYTKLTAYENFVKECQNNGKCFFDWVFELHKKKEHLVDFAITAKTRWMFQPSTPMENEMYYLQKFLAKCESVQALYNEPGADYQTKVFDIFCKYVDNSMKYGTLLIYYWRFKDYWSDENLAKIEKKLEQRKEAEKYFLSFFELGGRPLDNTFKKHAIRSPLTFFHAFIAIYMNHALEGHAQDQADILKLFCMTLHKVRNLRALIYTQNPECMKFKKKLYQIIITSGKFVPTEVETIFNRHWGDVINLYIWKAEINEYEKSTIRKIRDLDRGAYAVPAVVKAPDFASEVVAKYFTSAQETNAADEIECLMKLQFNPHVVQIFGFIVEQGTYVGVLMEYCKGGSLEKVISSKKEYDEDQIIWWAMQAASGLNFLHKKDVIHRDVKPANMLLDVVHHLLKISDLGISKMSPEPTKPLPEVDFPLTKWFGTPGFVPTDTVDHYSAEIDVFALGRSIWSMIFRKHPIDAEVTATLTAGTPIDISTELWQFVIRMIGPDKSARPTMVDCYKFIMQLQEKRTGVSNKHSRG